MQAINNGCESVYNDKKSRAAAANSEYCLPQAEIPLRKYAALHRAVPGDGGTVNDTVQSR